MKRVIVSLLLVASIFIGGCFSAGPFVTELSYDEDGNLVVTKDTVEFNWFFGTLYTGEVAETTVIKRPK